MGVGDRGVGVGGGVFRPGSQSILMIRRFYMIIYITYTLMYSLLTGKCVNTDCRCVSNRTLALDSAHSVHG